MIGRARGTPARSPRVRARCAAGAGHGSKQSPRRLLSRGACERVEHVVEVDRRDLADGAPAASPRTGPGSRGSSATGTDGVAGLLGERPRRTRVYGEASSVTGANADAVDGVEEVGAELDEGAAVRGPRASKRALWSAEAPVRALVPREDLQRRLVGWTVSSVSSEHRRAPLVLRERRRGSAPAPPSARWPSSLLWRGRRGRCGPSPQSGGRCRARRPRPPPRRGRGRTVTRRAAPPRRGRESAATVTRAPSPAATTRLLVGEAGRHLARRPLLLIRRAPPPRPFARRPVARGEGVRCPRRRRRCSSCRTRSPPAPRASSPPVSPRRRIASSRAVASAVVDAARDASAAVPRFARSEGERQFRAASLVSAVASRPPPVVVTARLTGSKWLRRRRERGAARGRCRRARAPPPSGRRVGSVSAAVSAARDASSERPSSARAAAARTVGGRRWWRRGRLREGFEARGADARLPRAPWPRRRLRRSAPSGRARGQRAAARRAAGDERAPGPPASRRRARRPRRWRAPMSHAPPRGRTRGRSGGRRGRPGRYRPPQEPVAEPRAGRRCRAS